MGVSMAKKSNKKETKAEEQEPGKDEQQELVAQLQRLQAEFENYKRRTEREFAEYREYAAGDAIKHLLPVLDNFELALKNVPVEDRSGFYKGVEMLYAQFTTALQELGVEAIDADGTPFDPKLHEAMLTEELPDAEKNTVIEVLQKGYLLKERVLRTAKVKVAK